MSISRSPLAQKPSTQPSMSRSGTTNLGKKSLNKITEQDDRLETEPNAFENFKPIMPPLLKLNLTEESRPNTNTRSRLKPLAFAALNDNDVMVSDSHKLDDILRSQAHKNHRRKINQEEGVDQDLSEEAETPAAQKNLDMISKLLKYKGKKGIVNNTKASKFEESIRLFKNVKTFIDIRKLVKGINVTDKNSSPPPKSLESPKHSAVKKFAATLTVNSFAEQCLKASGSLDARMISNIEGSGMASPVSPFLNGGQKLSDLNIRPEDIMDDEMAMQKAINEKERKRHEEIKKKAMKEREQQLLPSQRIQDAITEVKINLKSRMGTRILENIESKASSPNLKKQFSIRKADDLIKLRTVQEDLNDFKLFDTLVAHLSAQKGDPQEIGGEGPEEYGREVFYKRLDETLFDEAKAEEWRVQQEVEQLLEDIAEEKRRANFVINEEKEEEEKGETPMNYFEKDAQTKMIQEMEEYKKRTNKVITLLKKRTKRIHDEEKLKARTEAIKRTLTTLNLDKRINSNGSSKTGTLNHLAEGKTLNSTATPKAQGINKTKTFLSQGSIQLPVHFEDEEEEAMSPEANDLKHYNFSNAKGKNPLDKFFKGTGYGKSQTSVTFAGQTNQTYYMGNKKHWGKSIDEGKGRYTSYDGFPGISSKKKQEAMNYHFAVRNITDNANEILNDNRRLTEEISKTIKESDQYYSNKTRFIEEQDIPESLQMPRKIKGRNRVQFVKEVAKSMLKTNPS